MPIPSIIGLFDTSTGMRASDGEPPPASDGVFGQLLLLGVGRALFPFLLSPWVMRWMSIWL